MDKPTESHRTARWKELLLPEKKRHLPGERGVRTALRTVHLAAIAVLLGGHFFEVPAERLYAPLAWTIGSGAILILLEVYGSFDWFAQVIGLATLSKLLLLLLVPLFWEQRIWLLLAVLVIASVNTHMPSQYRHFSILTRKEAPERKG